MGCTEPTSARPAVSSGRGSAPSPARSRPAGACRSARRFSPASQLSPAATASGMRVLILGGTLFIGRRIALELLARGDDVMVVHRGQTEPAELSGCAHVHAARDALAGVADQLRVFRPDAVIDTRAMTRAHADAVLPHLPDAHLVLLSSIDVYRAYELLLAGRGACSAHRDVAGSFGPVPAARPAARAGRALRQARRGTSVPFAGRVCLAAITDLRRARRAAAGGVRAAEGP